MRSVTEIDAELAKTTDHIRTEELLDERLDAASQRTKEETQ